MEVTKASNDSQSLLNNSGGWRSPGPSPDELVVSALIGAVLSLMCLGGTAGNAYILVLMCRSLRCRASMYVHIVNLALADLLYLSTVPFIVYNSAVKDWPFGEAGCRVLLTLDLLTMHASIFTLTAMSSERYVAVTRPLAGAAGGARAPHRRAVTLLIWLLSFCLTLPLMIAIHVEERLLDDGSVRRLCTPAWSEESNKLYLTVLFGTSLLAPGLVIGYLYAGLARAYWLSQTRTIVRRSPRLKVLGLIFVIVLTYWACFLPFWSWQLVPLYAEPFRVSFKTQGLINNLVTCLTYGNSCVNPFLYTLLTKNYKEYLRSRQRGGPAAAAAAASRRSREATPAGGRPRRNLGLEEAAGTPGV
ncbi:urotensin-2 receptor-like [Heterodontus francisci]|uniref:urotensin-2 receptor-like n=1 Tax=Heterodontus francisci TaxID=7792 RepID=UPI00355C773B